MSFWWGFGDLLDKVWPERRLHQTSWWYRDLEGEEALADVVVPRNRLEGSLVKYALRGEFDRVVDGLPLDRDEAFYDPGWLPYPLRYRLVSTSLSPDLRDRYLPGQQLVIDLRVAGRWRRGYLAVPIALGRPHSSFVIYWFASRKFVSPLSQSVNSSIRGLLDDGKLVGGPLEIGERLNSVVLESKRDRFNDDPFFLFPHRMLALSPVT